VLVEWILVSRKLVLIQFMPMNMIKQYGKHLSIILKTQIEKNPCHDQARTGRDNYYVHYFNLGATGRAAGISPDVLLRTTDRKNSKAREMIQQSIEYKVVICIWSKTK